MKNMVHFFFWHKYFTDNCNYVNQKSLFFDYVKIFNVGTTI